MCNMHHGGLWMIITLMVRSNTLFLNTLIIKWSIVILWKISVFSVIYEIPKKKKMCENQNSDTECIRFN